ncbi:hypothetical protein H920_11690 [Fukomys damarensis]|uniref:Uncharacterized protein n=1 Tax=Fukomys damarensis TaxID=885580 RepID=A0A091D9H7_FUKDA|nr:hypothetical protein H920_11690 [Fukomys damarensis]
MRNTALLIACLARAGVFSVQTEEGSNKAHPVTRALIGGTEGRRCCRIEQNQGQLSAGPSRFSKAGVARRVPQAFMGSRDCRGFEEKDSQLHQQLATLPVQELGHSRFPERLGRDSGLSGTSDPVTAEPAEDSPVSVR